MSSASTATGSTISVVLDASVAYRAFVDADTTAETWFRRVHDEEVDAAWPDLVFAETGQAIVRAVLTGRLSRRAAQAAFSAVRRAPVRSVPLVEVADVAIEIALDRSISVYDACYVVLAETRKATLVTADRRLAAATATSVLI